MIVVMNAVRASGEQAKEFEEAFLARPRLLDQVDGFIRFELLRPQGHDEYLVVTYWRDRDAFEGWLGSDAFREAHKGLRDAELAHASEVRTYEVLDQEIGSETFEVSA